MDDKEKFMSEFTKALPNILMTLLNDTGQFDYRSFNIAVSITESSYGWRIHGGDIYRICGS